MLWIIGIVGIVLVGLIFIIFVSNNLSKIVIQPDKISIEDSLKREIEQNYIKKGYYQSLKREAFQVTTDDGYSLSCELIKSPKPSDKYIVFSHGFGFNRVGSIKYLDIFLEENFNIVLYDHRNSGGSEGPYTTMGYFEKEDLKRVIDYLYDRFGNKIFLGTHGESMGAATVLIHCAEDRRVKFVIADCPYSDLKDQLAFRLKIEHGFPRFPFLYVASFFSKLRAGFYFGQVSPIKVIADHDGLANLPIMFVHGDSDEYIPMEMSKDLFNAKKVSKKLYLAKGADHAISVCVDPERYENEVHDFLANIVKI